MNFGTVSGKVWFTSQRIYSGSDLTFSTAQGCTQDRRQSWGATTDWSVQAWLQEQDFVRYAVLPRHLRTVLQLRPWRCGTDELAGWMLFKTANWPSVYFSKLNVRPQLSICFLKAGSSPGLLKTQPVKTVLVRHKTFALTLTQRKTIKCILWCLLKKVILKGGNVVPFSTKTQKPFHYHCVEVKVNISRDVINST